MSKSLTIIGGTGFFGKSIIEYFNNDKENKYEIEKIYSISRKKLKTKKKINSKKIEFIQGDIKKMKSIPISDFYIYGATTTVKQNYSKNPKSEYKNITLGLSNFLKLIKKSKKENIKILFLSSGAVYGSRTIKKPIRENTVLNTNKFLNFEKEKKLYATGKLVSEKMIKDFAKKNNIKFSIARCFAFAGKHMPSEGHFFLANLFRSIKSKKIIKLESGSLKNIYRSYMHTDDLVNWLINILMVSTTRVPVYNVGSDKAYSLFQILKIVERKYKLKIKIKKQFKCQNDYYIPDISKAKKLKLSYERNFEKIFTKSFPIK